MIESNKKIDRIRIRESAVHIVGKKMMKLLKPLIPGERMKGAYAASKTMIDPFSFAYFTKLSSCALVATAPVGLLGEQK